MQSGNIEECRCNAVALQPNFLWFIQKGGSVVKALADPIGCASSDARSRARGSLRLRFHRRVPLNQPTVSHHLRLLREARLITCERRGTWVYYRLAAGAADRIEAATSSVLKQKAPAMKTHINLGTTNLDRSISFYSTLLNAAPTKVLPDYALFVIDDPGIELALVCGKTFSRRPIRTLASASKPLEKSSALSQDFRRWARVVS